MVYFNLAEGASELFHFQYTKNFLVASLQFYNDMEYLRNELLKE